MNKCFALKSKTCQVLNIRKLQFDKCSLYRTKAELDESLRVANARLAGLSQDFQISISNKYYNGEMPWI
jgi:Fe-S-cluster containining protein